MHRLVYNRRYKFKSGENLGSYIVAIGITPMIKKIGHDLPLHFILEKDGTALVMHSVSLFDNVYVRFIPGVEFNQKTSDERIFRTIITMEGNTLHEVQIHDNGKISTIDWIFSLRDLQVVMRTGDIVARRIYTAW
ncbi:hypothetical protein ILUMI_22564 [Ignelater luminosus]|uniref:Uncharacterized protein n=1 Tax=Ignelater luminosus TaxID=2038154 RepID=A0A8K0CGE5_IGNLU|nr:hypothetical protein ILUMI_22564 [Ignelater luminosus]